MCVLHTNICQLLWLWLKENGVNPFLFVFLFCFVLFDCLCVSVCLSVYLFVCLSACLAGCLPLPACLPFPACLAGCLSVRLFVSLTHSLSLLSLSLFFFSSLLFARRRFRAAPRCLHRLLRHRPADAWLGRGGRFGLSACLFVRLSLRPVCLFVSACLPACLPLPACLAGCVSVRLLFLYLSLSLLFFSSLLFARRRFRAAPRCLHRLLRHRPADAWLGRGGRFGLSVCLFVRVSLRLSVLFVCLFVCLSVCLSVCLCLGRGGRFCLSVCLFVFSLFVVVCLCLCVCVFVYCVHGVGVSWSTIRAHEHQTCQG